MGDKKTNKRNEEKKPIVVKNATDLQRLKLEKLMKNPEKPVVIPEPPKSKNFAPPPDFVRNVMGSSAGAGSGEFHVYRHLRRKEYARQKFIQEKSEKDKLEDEYHKKLEDNRKAAEERTAKKRAKRLKKKKNGKLKGKKPKTEHKEDTISQSDSSSEADCEGNDKDKQRVSEATEGKNPMTKQKQDTISQSNSSSEADCEGNDKDKQRVSEDTDGKKPKTEQKQDKILQSDSSSEADCEGMTKIKSERNHLWKK